MRIKEPDSDNALRHLYRQVDLTRDVLANCVNQNHNSTAVLYISSLTISPTVIFNNRALLQEISNIVSLSPKCVCVVRTTTPSYFPGSMATRQQQSIDFLRDKCYVVVYSKRREFLNHAKFLLHYQVCFSERTVHFGDFYGSTNLTVAGLSNPNRRGNFEEFAVHNRIKYRLSRSDRSYLAEVLELVTHKARLYTDRQYLSQYLSDHQRLLDSLIHRGSLNPSNPPKEELYRIYLDSITTYDQIFALLDEIPGKKLTKGIGEKLTAVKPPTNPFEIEIMATDPECVPMILDELDLSEKDLKDLIRRQMNALENAYNLIRQTYEPAIRKLESYFDEKETVFQRYLDKNYKTHVSDLERMVEVTELGRL